MSYLLTNRSLLEVTKTVTYKGHKIEQTESPIQIFFVVDGNLKTAYWSIADCKRAINGQQLVSLPVDIAHI